MSSLTFKNYGRPKRLNNFKKNSTERIIKYVLSSENFFFQSLILNTDSDK